MTTLERRFEMCCRAEAFAAPKLRHAMTHYLTVARIHPSIISDITTAVGEAIANVMEHAYEVHNPGSIIITAQRITGGRLLVEVIDNGSFITRERRSGRGFGMHIIKTIAESVSVDTSAGTHIKMFFAIPNTD